MSRVHSANKRNPPFCSYPPDLYMALNSTAVSSAKKAQFASMLEILTGTNQSATTTMYTKTARWSFLQGYPIPARRAPILRNGLARSTRHVLMSRPSNWLLTNRYPSPHRGAVLQSRLQSAPSLRWDVSRLCTTLIHGWDMLSRGHVS